jgi:hypothetical protein
MLVSSLFSEELTKPKTTIKTRNLVVDIFRSEIGMNGFVLYEIAFSPIDVLVCCRNQTVFRQMFKDPVSRPISSVVRQYVISDKKKILIFFLLLIN